MRFVLAAALIALSSAPDALAASGTASTGATGFVAFRGFPNFAQNSKLIPFKASTQATQFPMGLCCVTGAPPQVTAAVAEMPPVPDRKPVSPGQVSMETEAGVTVIRGPATHLPSH